MEEASAITFKVLFAVYYKVKLAPSMMSTLNNTGNNSVGELEVNCISYGCNFLIKLDNVSIVQAQLDKFEKQLRNKEKCHYDLKLPLSIIKCFSKLWKLWTDESDLHELIDEHEFRIIFEDMMQFFSLKTNETSTSASDLKSFCNTCKEKFEIVNNDLHFSYDLHTQTAYHTQMTTKSTLGDKSTNSVQKSFSNKANARHNSSVASVAPHLCKEASLRNCVSAESSQMKADMKSKVSKQRDITKQRMQVLTSMPTLKIKNNIQSPIDFRLPNINDSYCGICSRNISTETMAIREHLLTSNHKKQEQLTKKCAVLLKNQGQFIKFVNKKTLEFFCTLCNKVQTGKNCLLQHCHSKEHLNKLNNIAKTPKAAKQA